MAKTVEAMTETDTLMDALTEAERTHTALVAERNSIPRLFKAAVEGGEGANVLALRNRRDEIETLIELAAIEVERHKLAADEHYLTGEEQCRVDDQAAFTQADEEYQRAAQARTDAMTRLGNRTAHINGVKVDIAERKRRLAARIAKASEPPREVLRSAYRGGPGPMPPI